MMRSTFSIVIVSLSTAACAGAGSEPSATLPQGPASPTCINGWATPDPGSALRTVAIDMIRMSLGLSQSDTFVVDQMRYFRGPEDVGIIAPRRDVERWYVEARLRTDPSVAGRWIVRRTDVGEGVAYQAPYGTTGYEPGLWTGEEGEGAEYEPFNPPCTAAHGPYCTCDWGVSGCSCADSASAICTGPPPEVMGCLAGT